jgi:hypothetical protein
MMPPVAPQAPAVFQAPQATSDVSGPSESVGIRGFGIRIPECNFQLPTIQLPSVVRYRRGAEAHFESARSPQIAGMAAMPAQLAPGGASIPVAPPQAPSAPQAPQAPNAPTAPTAPALNCVPQGAGNAAVPGAAVDMQTVQDLIETRRALEAYRQELLQLRRSLESAPATVNDDPNVPPSPSVRRISRQAQPERNVRQAQIVEAGYLEEETDTDDVEDVFLVPVRGQRPRTAPVEAPRASTPVNQSRNDRQPRPASSPNVGYSYIAEEPAADGTGFGAWSTQPKRQPAGIGKDGSAKR